MADTPTMHWLRSVQRVVFTPDFLLSAADEILEIGVAVIELPIGCGDVGWGYCEEG